MKYDYKTMRPPKPEPAAIPPDFPVTIYPPGKNTKHALDGKFRDAKGRAPDSGRVVPKLVHVSVECTECGFSNPMMVSKRGLRRIRGKCQRCGKPINVQWTGVRSS